MNVVIIGTGNVATVLGRMIVGANHRVIQVVGRNPYHTDALAKELNTKAALINQINTSADLYIISVSDRAIAEVAGQLQLPGRLVVHTAGAMQAEVLQPITSKYGVIYPLQSIRKETVQLPVVPLLVDGADENVRNSLLSFAQTLSSSTGIAGNEQRMALHVGAVITSNFSNHLYSLAKMFCEKEHVSFDYLLPLIEETAQRLRYHSPENMQTGPAIRKDLDTMQKHLSLLDGYPRLQEIYQVMSHSIQETIRQ